MSTTRQGARDSAARGDVEANNVRDSAADGGGNSATSALLPELDELETAISHLVATNDELAEMAGGASHGQDDELRSIIVENERAIAVKRAKAKAIRDKLGIPEPRAGTELQSSARDAWDGRRAQDEGTDVVGGILL